METICCLHTPGLPRAECELLTPPASWRESNGNDTLTFNFYSSRFLSAVQKVSIPPSIGFLLRWRMQQQHVAA